MLPGKPLHLPVESLDDGILLTSLPLALVETVLHVEEVEDHRLEQRAVRLRERGQGKEPGQVRSGQALMPFRDIALKT